MTHRHLPEHGPGRIAQLLERSAPYRFGPVCDVEGAVHWMRLSIATELAPRGITVNAINPGPTDTGWMSPELQSSLVNSNPAGRVSQPSDAADLVSFYCRPRAAGSTLSFSTQMVVSHKLAKP